MWMFEFTEQQTMNRHEVWLSPAVRKMSCPSSAGFFDPDTGASRYPAPVALTASATATEVIASTVLTSM